MHTQKIIWSAVVTCALLLSACGTPQAGTGAAAPTGAAMAGMDHNAMATTVPGAMAGMDGSAMPMSNAPYDAQFIDGMVEHHRGAITMANQALQQSERTEIRSLAQNIITAQEAEIGQLTKWRNAWYPDLAPTGGMTMAMGPMEVPDLPDQAFDQRFMEAMIPHHQSAVTMAKDAQQKAEHDEIKTLTGSIITDQEKEIAQMQQWLQEWFGK